jgi:septation ring formation regulator EzrA
MDKLQILRNQVNAVNALHSELNKIVPILLQRLQKGYKEKMNGQFYEKDKIEIDAIIRSIFRIYISNKTYSMILRADTHYSDSENSCKYYARDVYLKDNGNNTFYPFEPLKADYQVSDILLAKNNIGILEEKKKDIENEIDEVRKPYFMFFER